MKERPILFSSPMVRALLVGTKTQTRRVMKPQPVFAQVYEYRGETLWDAEARRWWWKQHDFENLVDDWAPDRANLATLCPHGYRGDRLWVKEAISRRGEVADLATYDADDTFTPLDTWPWKRDRLPGMFMPYGLRRITLEITGVRVERLHAITDADARAEGCTGIPDVVDVSPREEFEQLWREINGAASWDANPWVWVVEFQRIEAA